MIAGVAIGVVLPVVGGGGLVEGVCLLEVGDVTSVIDLAIGTPTPTPAPTLTPTMSLQT